MDEAEQNKRFVIEERGTVVNDDEDDMSGSSENSAQDYGDGNLDSSDFADYMDHNAPSPSGSDNLYQDEGKHTNHGK